MPRPQSTRGKAMDDYFNYGPTVQENYDNGRGFFDGALGLIDGVSSIANSVGRIGGTVADFRENQARGNAALDNRVLDRQEREADLRNDLIKVERGDNVQLYYAAAGVGLAAVFLLMRG